MTSKSVFIVHRNDVLNPELDVFTDLEAARTVADAIDGWYEEQPILELEDEYVQQLLADHRDDELEGDQ